MSAFSLDFVEEFIDTSQRCTRPIELRDALMAHVSKLGFEMLAATHILDKPSVIRGRDHSTDTDTRLGTYPEAWAERFFEQDYFEVDSVSQRAVDADIPFFWNDCYTKDEPTINLSIKGRQFMAESSELELVRGVTIPVLNQGRKSSINLCGAYAQEGPGVLHMMHLCAIYFHQRLLALENVFGIFSPDTSVRLTPREQEILQWYAVGKSAWDISVVLTVSEAAVRFHLSNIREKYGVSSSVYATALAISRNDIRI